MYFVMSRRIPCLCWSLAVVWFVCVWRSLLFDLWWWCFVTYTRCMCPRCRWWGTDAPGAYTPVRPWWWFVCCDGVQWRRSVLVHCFRVICLCDASSMVIVLWCVLPCTRRRSWAVKLISSAYVLLWVVCYMLLLCLWWKIFGEHRWFEEAWLYDSATCVVIVCQCFCDTGADECLCLMCVEGKTVDVCWWRCGEGNDANDEGSTTTWRGVVALTSGPAQAEQPCNSAYDFAI